MPVSPDWSVSQLAPLIDWLSDIITEPDHILNIAERAECRKGKIPKCNTAVAQWQEVIGYAINEGHFEKLMPEIKAKVPGKSDTFELCLKKVGLRRLVELLGTDYAKLKEAIDKLFEEEEPKRQVEAATDIRRIVVKFWKELNYDISWQAFTPIETSMEEINKRRQVLVVLCVNIIGAADYMLALTKRMGTSGVPSNPENARTYLAAYERTRNSSSGSDDELRRTIDARMTLVVETSQLWFTLKETIALAPDISA
jgi:hypothetical protein